MIIPLLARCIAEGRATLGVRLGAQLIARALGASVAPGVGTEIGYGPLTLTADGARSVLRKHSIDRWLIGHSDALSAAAIDPRSLRADAELHGPARVHGSSSMSGSPVWLTRRLLRSRAVGDCGQRRSRRFQ